MGNRSDQLINEEENFREVLSESLIEAVRECVMSGLSPEQVGAVARLAQAVVLDAPCLSSHDTVRRIEQVAGVLERGREIEMVRRRR